MKTEKKIDDNGLIGAHTSASGGVWKAIEEGAKIGATMIQCFTANQRKWEHPLLTDDVIDNFKRARAKSKIQKVMSHASYLINLGNPDQGARLKSQKAFAAEIQRCKQLKIDYLNFHPGAALKGTPKDCLDHIIMGLLEMHDILEGSDIELLVETTAGQGSLVGAKFEEINYLISACSGKIPLGVCLDTCHIFAAGYDIRDAKGWDKVLKDFDKIIGLEKLSALHLNDTLYPLGSRKDRHAPLGKGEIGLDAFAYLMQSPHTAHLPMCLETPGGPALWSEEIKLLRGFRKKIQNLDKNEI